MATVQDIIDIAVDAHELNDANLANSSVLSTIISQAERRAYIKAAKENPDFFGKDANTATRTAGQSWDLTATPGDVAHVTRAEVQSISGTLAGIAVGDEVNIVRIRFPDADLAPRALLRGKTISEYDGELTQGSNFVETLKLYYSELPPVLDETTDTVSMPDEWHALLWMPAAAYLARRDERPQEEQLLEAEYEKLFADFLEHVRTFDSVTVGPFAARGVE